MSLMLIKQILDARNNESKLDASIVIDPGSGKNIVSYVDTIVNLLKDGTTDGSGNLPADYNSLLKISTSLAELKSTINDFLTGEDNGDDIDRLVELVKAIQDNKDSIDSLVADHLTKDDLVDALTSEETEKALTAAQGKVLKGLIDALEEAVNTKLNAIHEHDNLDVLENITQDANGNLEYNGKILDGATSVAMVSSVDGTPVFNEKLVLVVSPYIAPAESDD